MGGGRGQNTRAGLYLKLKSPVLLIPILASVSFRRLPWASVEEWEPCPHISLGCRQQRIWAGRRKPKTTGRYLPQISVLSDPYSDFSVRNPPPASVSFRQIPIASFGKWGPISTYILGRKTTMYVGGGRRPKFQCRYFPKIRVCSDDYPDFSIRQLPSASVGFRGQRGTISTNIAWALTTMYVGGGPEAKVHGPIFT